MQDGAEASQPEQRGLTPEARAAPSDVRPQEPAWLVRIVLVLVLVGLTAYLARELGRALA